MFLVQADRVAPVKATVTIDGAQLQMEVDTGTALSLISKATYSKLWPASRGSQLRKPAMRLPDIHRGGTKACWGGIRPSSIPGPTEGPQPCGGGRNGPQPPRPRLAEKDLAKLG